jgi:hypothetical protein
MEVSTASGVRRPDGISVLYPGGGVPAWLSSVDTSPAVSIAKPNRKKVVCLILIRSSPVLMFSGPE